jgi:hypothetical protein
MLLARVFFFCFEAIWQASSHRSLNRTSHKEPTGRLVVANGTLIANASTPGHYIQEFNKHGPKVGVRLSWADH